MRREREETLREFPDPPPHTHTRTHARALGSMAPKSAAPKEGLGANQGSASQLLESLVGKVEKTSSLTRYSKILRKRPQQRTEQEISFLVSGTSHVEFLTSHGPGVHRDLCRVLKLKVLDKYGSLKINEFLGWAHCFYWVLSGNIELRTSLPERHVITASQKASSKKNKVKLGKAEVESLFKMVDTDHSGAIDAEEMCDAFGMIGMNVNLGQIQDLLEQYDDDFSGTIDLQEFMEIMESTLSGGNKIGSSSWRQSEENENEQIIDLEKDSCFGSESILGTNTPLDCVLMSRETSHLVCLEKTEYERILERGFDGTLAQKISILNKTPAMRDVIRHSDIKGLAYSMRRDDILKGTVIIREGEKPDGVYFIISGECKLLQRIPESMQQEFLQKTSKGARKPSLRSDTFAPHRYQRMGSRGASQAKRKAFSNRFLSRQFEIGIVTSGNIVGEACLFGVDATSQVSVVAHTNLSVLILERNDLTKNLHALDLDKLKEHFIPRAEWHREHLSKIASTAMALASEPKGKPEESEREPLLPAATEVAGSPSPAKRAGKAKRKSSILPPLGAEFISPSVDKTLDSEKKSLLSAKNMQLLRNQKLSQSTMLAYSAIMNTKEAVSVKIAHRHLTSLGTSFFKHQMISSMKHDIVIPKRFCKTIRTKSGTYADFQSTSSQRSIDVDISALESTTPVLRSEREEAPFPSSTFMTEPGLS